MKRGPEGAAGPGTDLPSRARFGVRSLWNRVLWVPDPESVCPWATALLRCATLIFLAGFSLDVVADVVAGIIVGLTPVTGSYGVLLPFWWPWLALVAFLVAGYAGRRFWRGDSGLLLVLMPLVVFGMGFVSEDGYLVGWLAVPEALVFLAFVVRNSSTRLKAKGR